MSFSVRTLGVRITVLAEQYSKKGLLGEDLMTLTGVLAPAVPLQAQPVMWPLALPQLMTAASPALACHMASISGSGRAGREQHWMGNGA